MNLRKLFNWQSLFKDPTLEGAFASSGFLTPEQSIKLFDALVKMKDITYGYVRDGCHARAHLMCERLLSIGLPPQKAWALGVRDRPLTLQGVKSNIEWCFHVAPTLPVRQEDGTVEQMVFDPSLFDGPETFKRWSAAMDATPGKAEICPLGTPPLDTKGDYDLNRSSTERNISLDAKLVMRRYQKWNEKNYTPPFKSTLRTKLLSKNNQDPAMAFLREMNQNKGQ